MNPPRSIPRPRTAWAAAGTLALLALAGWHGIDRRALAADQPAAKAAPPVVATVATVQQQPMPVYRSGIGTVAATQSVTVKARVDGQLDRIGFTEGQDVKAGQILAHLDARALQAQLAQARATRAKDQATLANARVDLARTTQLIRDDAATQQQLDTQKALVAQLEAAVQTDDAQIAYAQVQLSYTTIVAPIGGRVGARLVDVGNIVHASDTTGLVVINQVDPITVVFTLPEEAFQDVNRALNASIASHQPLAVQATPRTGTGVLGTGSLTLLNNQIDTANGTVQLKARFPNPTHALWPGQYVNVRLQLGQRPDALTIPAQAVQRGQDGTFVYRVEPDGKTVQAQPVTVANVQDGVAVIDQGLSAGQQVVVDGQYKLKPGAVITAAAAGARQ
ncbi:efflux RND transporter periplasmic adaptor subunit [Pseudorhodoferax sp. Leaf274]|uniref:efflux RND transporter periplasmic adaptor subunit n=1 Tax=Pseudorhodoferax sp. Leaf274 TaxID=1736318 RepID=UPI0007034875|nr:efflux RND transporter periplasmic adaptor subunit [Pseudorhodoferax sp. Leaf274]KQP49453.1 RND transporter [Pseudorhodoferax sp. Leaf274]